jgi:hypothetical protein
MLHTMRVWRATFFPGLSSHAIRTWSGCAFAQALSDYSQFAALRQEKSSQKLTKL